MPSRRGWAEILNPLWGLVIWAFGFVMQVLRLPDGGAPEIAFFVLWNLVGTVFVLLLLWRLAGRETLRLDAQDILLERAIGPLRRGRSYETGHVRGLRAERDAVSRTDFRRQMGLYDGGSIAFDYGSNTVRFGAGLDDAEARDLVGQLIRELPRQTTTGMPA